MATKYFRDKVKAARHSKCRLTGDECLSNYLLAPRLSMLTLYRWITASLYPYVVLFPICRSDHTTSLQHVFALKLCDFLTQLRVNTVIDGGSYLLTEGPLLVLT
jgi:hypothetical protein